MTKRNRKNLSGTFKAKVALAHSTTYYRAQEVSEADLLLMHRIATPHLEHPFADSADVARHCGGMAIQSAACRMDGRDCWRDNMFVERLWKSIKCDEVSLRADETVNAAYDPKSGSWTGRSVWFLGCRARRNDAEWCDRAGRSSAFRRKVRPRSGMPAP